jgi:hypothetical protein
MSGTARAIEVEIAFHWGDDSNIAGRVVQGEAWRDDKNANIRIFDVLDGNRQSKLCKVKG